MYPDGIRPNRLAIPPQSEPETVPNRAPSVPGDATAPAQASSPTAVDLAGRGYHQAQDNLDVFNRTFGSQEVRNDPVLLEMRAGYEQSVKQARAGLKQAIEAEIKAGFQREFEARPTGAVYGTDTIDSHGQAIAARYADDPQMKKEVEGLVAEVRTDFEVSSTLDTARAMGDPRKALDYLRSETPKLSPEAQKSLAGNEEVLGWKSELGKRDGEAVTRAWREFETAEPGTSDYDLKRRVLEGALGDLRANAADPTYAEAVVKGVGAADLKDFVGGFYRIDSSNPNITPGNFDFLKGYFGPLAQVVATADRAGALPADTKKALFECGPAELALFLRSAPQTEGMMRDAMHMLLNGPGYTPAGNFAIQQLMVGMDQHPRLMQELLADQKASDLLFGSSLFAPDRGTNYEQDFARALNVALTPGQGDPATQQKVWSALIKSSDDKDWRSYPNGRKDDEKDTGFRDLINSHPLLARAMAEQFKNYLPWAANQQAQRYAGTHPIPSLPADALRLDGSLSPGQMTNFVAALSSDPLALDSLLKEATRLFQQGGLASMTPEMLKSRDQLALQGRLQVDFALFSLLLGGIARADIDEQGRRDAMADALKTIVMGYLLITLPPLIAPVVDVALSPVTTPLSKDLADFVQDMANGEQIDAKKILNLAEKVVHEYVKRKIAEIVPDWTDGERRTQVNYIMGQFKSTVFEKVNDEFSKDMN